MQSQHPLFLADTVSHILARLSGNDYEAARLTCRFWRDAIANPTTTKHNALYLLTTKFHVPESVAATLRSPEHVRKRLAKVFQHRLNDDVSDRNYLYRTYCANGTVNEDFLHLLDTDEKWFGVYFFERDVFFLAYHFERACMVGNFPLIQFLMAHKNCRATSKHFHLAVKSGDLASVRHLQRAAPDRAIASNVSHPGSLEVLKFFIEETKEDERDLKAEFAEAVARGDIESVTFLKETYECIDVSDITLEEIISSRSLIVLRYLLEKCSWLPDENEMHATKDGVVSAVSLSRALIQAAYRMGMIEVVCYIESRFPGGDLSGLDLFAIAATSGDLDCFKHLAEQHPSAAEELHDHDPILESVCLTGRLDTFRFLLKCRFRPKLNLTLILRAIESGNAQLVRAVWASSQPRPDPWGLISIDLSKSENLEMLAFAAEQLPLLENETMRQLCNSWTLISLYYFIEQEKLPVTPMLLRLLLRKYVDRAPHQQPDEGDYTNFFIEYLVKNRKLVPSVNREDLDTLRRVGDTHMLAVLGADANKEEQRHPESRM